MEELDKLKIWFFSFIFERQPSNFLFFNTAVLNRIENYLDSSHNYRNNKGRHSIRATIFARQSIFSYIVRNHNGIQSESELFFARNNGGNDVFVWNIHFCVGIMGVFIQTALKVSLLSVAQWAGIKEITNSKDQCFYSVK